MNYHWINTCIHYFFFQILSWWMVIMWFSLQFTYLRMWLILEFARTGCTMRLLWHSGWLGKVFWSHTIKVCAVTCTPNKHGTGSSFLESKAEIKHQEIHKHSRCHFCFATDYGEHHVFSDDTAIRRCFCSHDLHLTDCSVGFALGRVTGRKKACMQLSFLWKIFWLGFSAATASQV